MDNIQIIGITGYKNSGKDTIAKYYISNGYYKLSFADPIKEACKCIFSFTDEQLHNYEFKEKIDEYWKHSPREIFQKVGTELFRNTLPHLCDNINDDIWIKSIEKRIIKLNKENNITKFVIPDIRFINEADFIKKYNGKIILIKRFNKTSDTHVSEKNIDLIKYDYIVENTNTINNLYKKINELNIK